MFKKIPGTRDILPDEAFWWQKIEAVARNIFCLYNYKEMRLPLIEDASLFNRSLGESAEIVQKQMFLVRNKDDIYALRPEGTASVVRAYIENNLDKTAGFAKLYYIGPMFRLERPQRGRLRQFHHIGCEAIGSLGAGIDAEIISLADGLLKSFGIEGYKIKINTLGCLKDKTELADNLRSSLKERISGFCVDCQNRLQVNVLRILDCKNETCRQELKKLDINDKHLCPECKNHFLEVRNSLDALKIDYEVTPLLVRGLDYYTRTVFEISHNALGAQDALCAGGRYNNLVKDLGGPDAGAVGFAFGVERVFLVSGDRLAAADKGLVFLITLGEEAKKQGLKLLSRLRAHAIACDTDYEGKSLKGAMRQANDLKAGFVLILGENELKNNTVTLKDMISGEQREVKAECIINELMTNNKTQMTK